VLLLVRHGETAANVAGVLLGRADPSLTDVGRSQARWLAETLPVPALVVSSPLRRARETAAAFGVDVVVDERWNELDYGELDGLAPSGVAEGMWQQWRSDVSFAPPGGESLDQLSRRVGAGCAALAGAAATGVVVVVTHVSPIKAAIAWTLGVSEAISWKMWVEDASVSRIDFDASGPTLRWFNRGGWQPDGAR
jgi:alpha-ribazole phosphatase